MVRKQLVVEIYFPERAKPLRLSGTDIRVMLLRRGERISDLADRLGCRRESLSRLLHGHVLLPAVKKKLIEELTRMIREEMRAAS
jgi:hypothetical protein